MKNYHLVHKKGDWKLQKEHAERASISFGDLNKEAAIRQSAAFLGNRSGSLKIHKLDGTIQEERTYPRSADPTKSKG
ncbi:MAG TPA: DUF2188 domain-containing protein [Chitinophagaceae bacterium]|nr:DUF2188 domain-containing protein [Chitinophagaceae bacterium]